MSHEQSVMRWIGHMRLASISEVLCAGIIAWAFLFTVQSANAQKPDEQTPISIVILGDSLTAGFGLQPGEGFPERLQAAFDARKLNVAVTNAGVSGDTSAGGLARLDWSVPDGTDGVVVELGANDALRGVPPEKTRQNLAGIIERLQSRGVSVMLAGMLAPPNMGPVYGDAFNGIYPDLAAEYDVALYPFFLDGVAAVRDLNLSDGIHPNAKGIEVMVGRFVGPAAEWLDTIRLRRQAAAE